MDGKRVVGNFFVSSKEIIVPFGYGKKNVGHFPIPSIEELNGRLKKQLSGHTSLEMIIIDIELDEPWEGHLVIRYEMYQKGENEEMARERVWKAVKKLCYPWLGQGTAFLEKEREREDLSCR